MKIASMIMTVLLASGTLFAQSREEGVGPPGEATSANGPASAKSSKAEEDRDHPAGARDSSPPPPTILTADSDRSTETLGDTLTAGYDKHFFIGTLNRKFLMQIYAKLQIRYIANESHQPPGTDEDVNGFQLRRTELYFKGRVFDPRLTYKIKIDSLVKTPGPTIEADFDDASR